MSGPVIKTPRGTIVINASGKAELTWNAGFRPVWQHRYSAAQQFVDSEVLRQCEPYIPLLTGMLIKSGILGTEVGSGLVQWIAIYSHYQYYLKRKPGTQTGALRGPFWFQRWKEVGGERLVKQARKMAGGR